MISDNIGPEKTDKYASYYQRLKGIKRAILCRAICGVLMLTGASYFIALFSSHRGWIFVPLYIAAVWAWYFLEIRFREFRLNRGLY